MTVNVKSYLMQIRMLDSKIRILSDEVAQYEAIATKVTPTLDKLNVQSSPGNAKEKAIIEYVTCTQRLSDMLHEYSEKRNSILSNVLRLQNADYIELLYLRYFEFKSWDRISEELGLSDSWMYELHGKALSALKTELNRVEKE